MCWFTEDNSYFKLSAQYLYGLSRTRLTCFYLIAGVSYKYTRDKETVYHWGQPNEEHWDANARWAVGAGLGIATRKLIHERIWWSVELPLTYTKNSLIPWPTATVHYLVR